MKAYFLKTLLIIFTIFLISCSNGSDDALPIIPIECPDDALHTVDGIMGEMIYLPCYDAWGVKLLETLTNENQTIGVSLDISEEYEIEELKVQLDACFYEFDLPLILPDPAPWGSLYRMENVRIVDEN